MEAKQLQPKGQGMRWIPPSVRSISVCLGPLGSTFISFCSDMSEGIPNDPKVYSHNSASGSARVQYGDVTYSNAFPDQVVASFG